MQPLERGSSFEPAAQDAPALSRPKSPWYYKLAILLFIIVCFEVGVFLVVFPWMDYWGNNSIAAVAPWVRSIWESNYFRGALTGLGVINIYISLAEIFRLRRSAADKMKVSVI